MLEYRLASQVRTGGKWLGTKKRQSGFRLLKGLFHGNIYNLHRRYKMFSSSSPDGSNFRLISKWITWARYNQSLLGMIHVTYSRASLIRTHVEGPDRIVFILWRCPYYRVKEFMNSGYSLGPSELSVKPSVFKVW